MVVFVRLRTFLARHPLAWWAMVALCASSAAWGAVGVVQRLEGERRSWGDRVTVWVVQRDTAPGEPIVARPVDHPRAVVAPGALRRDPAGLVAVQHLGVGEVVATTDVGRSGLELLPADWRGVAVPLVDGAIGLTPGHGVDVVAAGRLVASGAVVVAVSEETATVGVPADLAPTVADAVRLGDAALVLRPD